MRRLDVDQMLSEMSSAALAKWAAYYLVEPWGEEPAERRFAVQDTLIVGTAGRKCKPDDFLPEAWKAPKESEDWQEMKKKVLRSRGIKE